MLIYIFCVLVIYVCFKVKGVGKNFDATKTRKKKEQQLRCSLFFRSENS